MSGRKRPSHTPAQRPQQGRHEGFYRALEDRFRGSRELIRARLCVYLPFIEPLKAIDDRPAAVDLGCGRGEWLELLTENGFDVQGVDLDEGMLAAGYENDLRVTKEDAIAFLEKLPNGSQSIVSGFHIAEHLPFPQLQRLVEEALRVLKPAGLLILETPNPENIRVSSLTFYLDPTHRHPLPPALLSFLLEYYGFERVKVIRLQENRGLLESAAACLNDVLGGASLDYAVIAQKASADALARPFDAQFAKDFGLSADVLVSRFDRQLAAANERAAALEARFDQARNSRTALEAQAAASETRVNCLAADVEAMRAALAAIHASRSWPITAPLRRASQAMRWCARGAWAWLTLRPGCRPRRVARRSAVAVGRFLRARPRRARPASYLLRLLPAIEERCRTMLSQADALLEPIQAVVQHDGDVNIASDTSAEIAVSDAGGEIVASDDSADIAGDDQHMEGAPEANVESPAADDADILSNLSPHARRVYAELKAAIAMRGESR
jgi:SAM-dependent methyltransferase